MIAVIADDFTGAAEIGGLGLKHNLNVVIEANVSGDASPDLLIIVADTRSMTEHDAVARIREVTSQLIEFNPKIIYKKVDSVLRGHVYKELIVQRECENKNKVIVVAGNPKFGRLIIDGKYYVSNTPLAETGFASDPEFPAKSSDVAEIVGGENVTSYNVGDELPDSGFVIANVETDRIMSRWLEKIDDTWVIGGGAAFFDKMLAKLFDVADKGGVLRYNEHAKGLYVFGSTYPKLETFIKSLEKAEVIQINLAEDFFADDITKEDIVAKAKYIADNLAKNNKVALSSMPTLPEGERLNPNVVKNRVSELTKSIFECIHIDELYIEGGATASCILSKLNMERLIPTHELAAGIIQMEVGDSSSLKIVTKPGSYEWPTELIPSI